MQTRRQHRMRVAMMGVILTGVMMVRADNNELAQIGEDYMNAGKYLEAIKKFEKITPTYEHILSVNFDLAWCYYLTEAYEKAIPLFESLSGVRAPSEEVKQQALFLLAECRARLAETQEETKPDRKKNITQAIDLHTKFQTDYSKNKYIPNSLYGRAFAYYLNGQLDKAETDLLAIIKHYPGNAAARDGQYLLANVYSQQALALIKAGKKEASKPFMEKARALFSHLSKSEGNLAIANDSVFALAETWFSAGMYLDAIRYFREVRSKTDVLKDLRSRLGALDQKRAAEIGKGQDTALTHTEIDKLKAQLNTVSEEPDLMISSYFRIAMCFIQLRRFDEMRVICNHLLKFTREEQKQQAYYLIVTSTIEEKNAEEAARAFEGFQQSFGLTVPIAEMASLAIGQLCLQREQPENALQQFTKSVEEYPEGPGAEDALFMKFSTEFMLNQAEMANQTTEIYLDKYPKGKYIANALYLKAMSLAALTEWDEALITINELIQRFPKKTDFFQAVDEASYQKGWMLYQKAQSLDPDKAPETEREKVKNNKQAILAEAILQLETFLEQFKESKLRPVGMYQLGIVLNAAGQFDQAKAVLQNIAKEYPDHEIAPTALYQIAVMYYDQEDFPHMGEALEVLAQQYPSAPIIPEAYFWLGWVAKKDFRYDDAIDYFFSRAVEGAPASHYAPECLFLMAQSYAEKADKMGLPALLSEEKKAIFRASLLEAAQTYEMLLVNYPDSAQALEAIPGIAKNISDLVLFRLSTEEQAVAYFNKAKGRHRDDVNTQARLAFSMGTYFLKNKQKDKALESFKEAFTIHPDARLSPVMFSDYAEALKDAHALDKAESIYQKIIAEYAGDPRALAPAWFGIADIKYRQNNFVAAKAYFEKVLKEFPWYEPGKQGKVKLATILERNKNYAEAEKMFIEVYKQEKGGEARIGAMLGVARCQLARAEAFRQEGNITSMKTMLKAADDNVTKIIVLYEAFPDYVSEALGLKGRAYELAEDPVKARETYDRLVKEYKNYPPAKPAAERLQKLGGPLPAAQTPPAAK